MTKYPWPSLEHRARVAKGRQGAAEAKEEKKAKIEQAVWSMLDTFVHHLKVAASENGIEDRHDDDGHDDGEDEATEKRIQQELIEHLPHCPGCRRQIAALARQGNRDIPHEVLVAAGVEILSN